MKGGRVLATNAAAFARPSAALQYRISHSLTCKSPCVAGAESDGAATSAEGDKISASAIGRKMVGDRRGIKWVADSRRCFRTNEPRVGPDDTVVYVLVLADIDHERQSLGAGQID